MAKQEYILSEKELSKLYKDLKALSLLIREFDYTRAVPKVNKMANKVLDMIGDSGRVVKC